MIKRNIITTCLYRKITNGKRAAAEKARGIIGIDAARSSPRGYNARALYVIH